MSETEKIKDQIMDSIAGRHLLGMSDKCYNCGADSTFSTTLKYWGDSGEPSSKEIFMCDDCTMVYLDKCIGADKAVRERGAQSND